MIDARMATLKLLLAGARWSGASSLAAPLLARSGAILMFHRITVQNVSPLGVNAHLSITPAFLDALLADLRRRGHTLVSLDEMLEALAKGGGRGAVALTADDGWLDNLTEALPVFEAHEAPVTIYVAPGLTGGEIAPWWELVEELVAGSERVSIPGKTGDAVLECREPAQKRRVANGLIAHFAKEVPERDQQDMLRRIGAMPSGDRGPMRRFLDWDEIRSLSAHTLVTIGAHTVHHYNLRRLPAADALSEMTRSAAIIEQETGLRPRHFAYPYGYAAAVGPREVELAAQAGFASAVTTRHGVLHHGHADHVHALPRISVNGNFQRLTYMRALLSGLMTPLANGGRRLVTV